MAAAFRLLGSAQPTSGAPTMNVGRMSRLTQGCQAMSAAVSTRLAATAMA
jgi:hypothetical protein